MDRIQLARLRGFAIGYLPKAQMIDEQENMSPVGDRDSRTYETRLWNVAQEVIARKNATDIELAAAMLLGAITQWELFEPDPNINKLIQAYTGQETNYTRDKMLPGIANAVTTLNNETGKNIPFASGLAIHTDWMETPSNTGIEEPEPWLIIDPKDPQPEQPWYTPARYFARKHVKENSNLLANKDKLEGLVVLSLNNAGISNSRNGKFKQNGTILKAWVGVKLG
jgi:hypothetical protein